MTFVLSPTLIKLESGRMTSGSNPLNFVNGSTDGILRGTLPSTLLTNAVICSGVVPQQPPMILTRRDSVNSLSCIAIWSGDSS